MTEIITKPTTTIHKKISERASQAQMQVIISRVIELIGQNMTSMNIKKVIRVEFNKSYDQSTRYLRKATELLKESYSDNTAHIRAKRIHGLEKDLELAYKHYQVTDGPLQFKWFEQYLAIKKMIDQYYPDALQPQSENESTVITISYNKPDIEVESEQL